MKLPRIALFAVLASILGAPAARADYINTYIAVTCDTASSRMMLRFGYADSDAHPAFRPLEGSPAGDPSRAPITNPWPPDAQHEYRQEVACTMRDGRRVRARYGFGPTAAYGRGLDVERRRFGLWIGRRKVVVPDAAKDCLHCSIHSIAIANGMLRRCDFHPDDNQGPYDLIDKPVPITCTTPMPMKRIRDPIEFPPQGTPPRPAFGTMTIPVNRSRLCRSLLFDEAKMTPVGIVRDLYSDMPLGSTVVSLSRIGGPFDAFTPVKFPGNPPLNGSVGKALIPVTGRVAQQVYRVAGGNNYFGGSFFLVAPRDVPEGPVLNLLVAKLHGGDLDDIDRAAKAAGLLAFTGDLTPFRDDRYTTMEMFRYRGVTYIASNHDWADPTAVVSRPLPSGRMKTVCIFQNIGLHF